MGDVTVLKDMTTPEGIRVMYVQPHGVCSQQIGIAVKDGDRYWKSHSWEDAPGTRRELHVWWPE